jgi:hypothetical protein
MVDTLWPSICGFALYQVPPARIYLTPFRSPAIIVLHRSDMTPLEVDKRWTHIWSIRGKSMLVLYRN